MTQDLYNIEDKNNFLSQYENENTIKAFVRVFNDIKDEEIRRRKDIYLFTKDELESFYQSLNFTTEITARNYGRMLNQYINWAVEEDKIEKHPFPVQQFYFTQFINSENNVTDNYMTIQELIFNTRNYFENAQDSVLLELIFNGVQGKSASEICNLTVNDIDEENRTITVYNHDGRKRVITDIDKGLIDLCFSANKELIYYKRNREMKETSRIKNYTELIQGVPYVIKNSNTNTVHEDKATKFTIYNRLKIMQKFEQLEDDKKKLTIKNISRSGQIYYAKSLLEKDGEIDLEQVRKVAVRFGINEHWSMRDYLNEETILKLYPNTKVKTK